MPFCTYILFSNVIIYLVPRFHEFRTMFSAFLTISSTANIITWHCATAAGIVETLLALGDCLLWLSEY